MNNLNINNEYCTNCNQVFPKEDLTPCEFMFSASNKRIVTKTGIKEIKDSALECNGCKNFQHQNQGEWI